MSEKSSWNWEKSDFPIFDTSFPTTAKSPANQWLTIS
jgi:hypothetical protein